MALRSDAPVEIIDAYDAFVAVFGREPTVADVEVQLQGIVGLIPVEPWMDTDDDGKVDIFDSILLQQVIEAIAQPATGFSRGMILVAGGVLAFLLLAKSYQRQR